MQNALHYFWHQTKTILKNNLCDMSHKKQTYTYACLIIPTQIFSSSDDDIT